MNDVKAIERCCKALETIENGRRLEAALRFLWDRYIIHPPLRILEKFHPERLPTVKTVSKET